MASLSDNGGVAPTPVSHSGAYEAPRISGNYHGVFSRHPEYDDFVAYTTFEVEIDGPTFILRSVNWGGEPCEFSAPWYPVGTGYVRADGGPDATTDCNEFDAGGLFYVIANGERLYGSVKDHGGVVITGSKLVPHVP